MFRLAKDLSKKATFCDRLRWVTGGKYSANVPGGGFRALTGPSFFVQADFGSRPIPAGQAGPVWLNELLRHSRCGKELRRLFGAAKLTKNFDFWVVASFIVSMVFEGREVRPYY